MPIPERMPLNFAGTWAVVYQYEPGDIVVVPYLPPFSYVTGTPWFLCTERAAPGGGAPGNPEWATLGGRPIHTTRPNGKWEPIGGSTTTSQITVPWRGDWRADVAYQFGDMVSSEGSAYYASSHIDAGHSRPGRWARDDPWQVVVRSRFPLFHSEWNSATAYNAWDIVQHRLKWWSPISPDNAVIGLEPGADDNNAWQILLELPDSSKWKPNEIASLTTSVFSAALSTTSLGLTAGKFGLELRKLQAEVGRGVATNVQNALNDALRNPDQNIGAGLDRLGGMAREAQNAAEQARAAAAHSQDALRDFRGGMSEFTRSMNAVLRKMGIE